MFAEEHRGAACGGLCVPLRCPCPLPVVPTPAPRPAPLSSRRCPCPWSLALLFRFRTSIFSALDTVEVSLQCQRFAEETDEYSFIMTTGRRCCRVTSQGLKNTTNKCGDNNCWCSLTIEEEHRRGKLLAEERRGRATTQHLSHLCLPGHTHIVELMLCLVTKPFTSVSLPCRGSVPCTVPS